MRVPVQENCSRGVLKRHLDVCPGPMCVIRGPPRCRNIKFESAVTAVFPSNLCCVCELSALSSLARSALSTHEGRSPPAGPHDVRPGSLAADHHSGANAAATDNRDPDHLLLLAARPRCSHDEGRHCAEKALRVVPDREARHDFLRILLCQPAPQGAQRPQAEEEVMP